MFSPFRGLGAMRVDLEDTRNFEIYGLLGYCRYRMGSGVVPTIFGFGARGFVELACIKIPGWWFWGGACACVRLRDVKV